MRNKLIKNLALMFALISCQIVYGDSPITSTNFHTAYSNLKIVKYAESKGILDKKIARYLLSNKISIDKKAAVINALSWDINGKHNTDLFIAFLADEYKKPAGDIQLSDLTSDELFCLGYMLVMDDYFNPEDPLELLKMAKRKNPKSYTISIICALIESQVKLDEFAWCDIWEICTNVKNDPDLNNDLSPEADRIIFEYIGLYQEECN